MFDFEPNDDQSYARQSSQKCLHHKAPLVGFPHSADEAVVGCFELLCNLVEGAIGPTDSQVLFLWILRDFFACLWVLKRKEFFKGVNGLSSDFWLTSISFEGRINHSDLEDKGINRVERKLQLTSYWIRATFLWIVSGKTSVTSGGNWGPPPFWMLFWICS